MVSPPLGLFREKEIQQISFLKSLALILVLIMPVASYRSLKGQIVFIFGHEIEKRITFFFFNPAAYASTVLTIRPSFSRMKIGQHDLNCQALPTTLHTTVGFQWCLLKFVTVSEWNVNHSRRKEECSLRFSLCFFLALQHWVSKTGKECSWLEGWKEMLPRQGTQLRDSIHQLHGGPGPTHYLSREAGGHLSPSTVPHGPLLGRQDPMAPVETS